MSWDPAQYLRFADLRLRPALDLLGRVDLEAPAEIVDLGCGAGNVTRLIARRFPHAAVTGFDGSPEMLAKAAETPSSIAWRQGDIGAFEAPVPLDLLYSNAALHWLGAHERLFPRLFAMVRPGGVFAVQMPRNYGEASHTGMVAVVERGPWAAKLGPLLRRQPVAGPDYYYDLLAPQAARLDIWETIYTQVLEGEHGVVEFTRGTALKPLLDALSEAEGAEFLAAYRADMARAYPRRADGRTLFPFRRLFIVAVRK